MIWSVRIMGPRQQRHQGHVESRIDGRLMPQFFMLTSSACITCSILSDSFPLKFVHTRQAPGQDSQVTRHDEAAFFFFLTRQLSFGCNINLLSNEDDTYSSHILCCMEIWAALNQVVCVRPNLECPLAKLGATRNFQAPSFYPSLIQSSPCHIGLPRPASKEI